MKRLAVDSALAAGVVAAGLAWRRGALEIPRQEGEATPAARRGRDASTATPPGKDVRPVVAIARGDDPAALARAAVEALGGMGAFVSRGERVLLKPNIGWDRPPKFAANTNPDVVASVARLCLEAGAKEVVVTDSPCNNPQRCFDKSGLAKALEGLGVKLFVPTERDYVEKDLGGEVLRVWPVLRAVLECDKVVNLPIAKHHSSAVLTLGMKNWYGILGGGKRRGALHQEMARSIAELASFVRPVLTVLDAYRILVRNGPQGGSLMDTRETKTVMASRDAVAVDALASTLFELTPKDVPYVPLGEQMGLGRADLEAVDKITVSG
ncbi:MAG: DUF362 domain-containing protein [Planctomycetota bacterium]